MAIPRIRFAGPVGVVLGGALLLAGCGSISAPRPAERADYQQTLNKYYLGRPMCLWNTSVKFPVVNATPEMVDDLGLDSLEDAGLLTSHRGTTAETRTYDLTVDGKSALNPDVLNTGAGNFCYGRREVVSVDKARQNSTTTELVDYQYAIRHAAPWAVDTSVQEAFPQVVSELAGPHSAEVTLLDTTDGWEVSKAPSIAASQVTRPTGAMVARVSHSRRPE